MPSYNTYSLSRASITLHWLAGSMMIYMLLSGLLMESLEVEWLFDSHTSLGVAIIAVLLPRIAWRIIEGWPEPVEDYSHIEKYLGKVVHGLLMLSMIMMPLSGVVMSVAGGHGLHIFALEVWPETVDPNTPSEVLILSPTLQKLSETIHHIIGQYLLPITLVLHIAGALKHHIIDKDRTLLRMLGQ
ncbi:cytochrome b [Vibrio fortis]|uniref:cytochrome b n=1 Tax=Vibrio fortis TaxID=212667 RepID=UPI002F40BEC3